MSWSFYDPSFYVRDQRTEGNQETGESSSNVPDINMPFNAVASDHTYPRNPDSPQQNTNGDQVSPLITSLHIVITHIQRQARLLRQQVESIGRIDRYVCIHISEEGGIRIFVVFRAMVEVSQLRLMRQLVLELVRNLRSITAESRSSGMSSVRQMMAGTRISDSGPCETSTAAEGPSSASNNDVGNVSPPVTASPPASSAQEVNSSETNNSSTSAEPSTSSGGESSLPPRSKPRTSGRKTYPPSRSVTYFTKYVFF